MRAVVQKVLESSVKVDGEIIGSIGKGFTVLLGIETEDTIKDLEYMENKISNLRIFEDEEGKLNLSLKDVKGEILLISQFTLYGDARKGNRPSFIKAMKGDDAEKMYLNLVERLRNNGFKVETGKFGADMKVSILNDGPVTILLDSSKML